MSRRIKIYLLINCGCLLFSGILYKSPTGAMLSQIIHSLLLLPPTSVRPLLHELLSLLPHLDKLNRLLPAASVLEQQELNWPLHGIILIIIVYKFMLKYETCKYINEKPCCFCTVVVILNFLRPKCKQLSTAFVYQYNHFT